MDGARTAVDASGTATTAGTRVTPSRHESGTPVSAEEYERVALAELDVPWELHRGRLREKPGTTWDHGDVISHLGYLLQAQLSRDEHRVHLAHGRLRRATENYYVPDLVVIPLSMGEGLRGRSDRLEVFRDPVPLVVEVWSPSTGGYDVDTKVPEYQDRGDLEIWRIHPYERTLTTWRRRPDGTYATAVYRGGEVRVESPPGVVVDLDVLFDA